MLLKVELPYNKEADSVDWEEVKKLHPLAPEEQPKSRWEMNRALEGPTRLTDEEIAGLAVLGFTIEVIPYPGAMVTKMKDRKKWDHDEPTKMGDMLTGAAVQIVVPDMALLLINEVEVCENFCTHSLQGMLDSGWRILAVCPPNAARRPDYVLGRRKIEG